MHCWRCLFVKLGKELDLRDNKSPSGFYSARPFSCKQGTTRYRTTNQFPLESFSHGRVSQEVLDTKGN